MIEQLEATLLHSQTPAWEIVVRMLAAVVLGAVIGIEREARNKAAGLRTQMLISLAAAVFTLLTFELMGVAAVGRDGVTADPVRVTEAVVTGVAFLGAGTIIQARGRVEGITTGASIWLAGAIGVACGGGYFVVAGATVVVAILILFVMGVLKRRVRAFADGNDGEGETP